MGFVACVESVSTEDWPEILARTGRAGILIDAVWEAECKLHRGPIVLGMGIDLTRPMGDVYIWCSPWSYYRRPLATRRLVFELMRIVRTGDGGLSSSSGE